MYLLNTILFSETKSLCVYFFKYQIMETILAKVVFNIRYAAWIIVTNLQPYMCILFVYCNYVYCLTS